MSIQIPSLPLTLSYSSNHGIVTWEGYLVQDEDDFRNFMTGPVRERAADPAVGIFEAELQNLDATGMSSSFLQSFLESVPDEKGWALGEAFAEAALSQDQGRDVVWPWSHVRDRRTPRASLPGADLVGFVRDQSGCRFLIGEVKTSSDTRNPPNVMYGKKGMPWQLLENASRLDIQRSLLYWLRMRCTSPKMTACYREAATRFLQSDGREFVLVGILLRDTKPNAKDVASIAKSMSKKLSSPMQAEITAWHLPVPIAEWPQIVEGQS